MRLVSPRVIIGFAGALFVVFYAVAAWRGNALFYAAGGLIAAAVLAPLWRSRPRILLLALLFYLPLEDAMVGAFPHNQTAARVVPDVLLFGALALRFLLARRRGERLLGTALDLPLAGLLVVALISMLLNHIPLTQALQGPYTLFRYAALFYLTASCRFEEREIRFLVRGLVWVCIAEGGLAILQFLNYGGSDPLPSGTIAGPNTLGLYLALVCTIAVAFYSDQRMGLPRRELWAVLGISFAATLVTLSRQSTMALLLGPAVICLFLVLRREPVADVGDTGRTAPRWQWSRLEALWPGAVSSLVGGAAGFLAVKVGGAGRLRPVTLAVAQLLAATRIPGVARWAAGVIANIGTSGYVRQLAYKTTQTGSSQLFSTNFYDNPRLYTIANAAPAIVEKSPLFGFGPGTFGARATFHDHRFYDNLHVGLLLRDASFTFVADVEWMTILGQLGLLGVAGILWLLCAIGWTGARIWTHSRQPVAQALGSVCVALVPIFLVICWFGPNLELRPIASLLWFIPGLALSVWRSEERGLAARQLDGADTGHAQLVAPTSASTGGIAEAPRP
jgi:hypothetical protein